MKLLTFLVLGLLLCGCTIAPHGSKTVYDTWFYANGQVVRHERVTDRSAGGGLAFLTDPKASSATITHTNAVLRVGGSLTIGNGSVTVDSASIEALGTAVGNIAAAIIKKSLLPALP